MATYGEMKSRIADEFINESVTTAQIENAIKDAIKFYERKPFYFNEARDDTSITTVAGTEYYSADIFNTSPKIVSVKILDDGLYTPLTAWSYQEIEDVQDGSITGDPVAYCVFKRQLRLYPIPDDADVVTVSYIERYATLSGEDDENVWTTDAEALIRNSAKRRIALEVLHAEDIAARCAVLEKEEYDEILAETRRRKPNTVLRASPMLDTNSFNINTGN